MNRSLGILLATLGIAAHANLTAQELTAEADAASSTNSNATNANDVSDENMSSASESFVMDRLDLGTTSITGNQELPKVLYIVPWKRSDLGDLLGRPLDTLVDEVLAPVDPEVFERQLSYYESLQGETEE